MTHVSAELYQDIEESLEQYYNSQDCVYNRLFKNGKRVGYQGVLDNFDLKIDPDKQLGKLTVKLVSKVNEEYVPFNEEFYGVFVTEDMDD